MGTDPEMDVCSSKVVVMSCPLSGLNFFLVTMLVVGFSFVSLRHWRNKRAAFMAHQNGPPQSKVVLITVHERLVQLAFSWACLSWVVSMIMIVAACSGRSGSSYALVAYIAHSLIRTFRIFLFVIVFVYLSLNTAGKDGITKATKVAVLVSVLYSLRTAVYTIESVTQYTSYIRLAIQLCLTAAFSTVIYRHRKQPHQIIQPGQGELTTPLTDSYDLGEAPLADEKGRRYLSWSPRLPATSSFKSKRYSSPYSWLGQWGNQRASTQRLASLTYKRPLQPFGWVALASVTMASMSSFMDVMDFSRVCVGFRLLENILVYVVLPYALYKTLLADSKMCQSLWNRAEAFAGLPRIGVGQIRLGETIGGGSGGTVVRAKYKSAEVCVKKFVVRMEPLENLKKFEMEASMVGALDHPNIVKVLGVCNDDPNLYLVMELCTGGDLMTFLHDPLQPLPYSTTIRLINELANALEYLHEKGIIHRDLKSPNVLLHPDSSNKLTLKLADFELSHFQGSISLSSLGNECVGTLEWMAPEVLLHWRRQQPQGRTRSNLVESLTFGIENPAKCDVYAFGVIMYELLTRNQPPLSGTPMSRLWDARPEDMFGPAHYATEFASDGSQLSPQLKSLLASCLAINPNDRPSFTVILERLANV